MTMSMKIGKYKEKKSVAKSEPDAFEIVNNLQSGASELFSKLGKVYLISGYDFVIQKVVKDILYVKSVKYK